MGRLRSEGTGFPSQLRHWLRALNLGQVFGLVCTPVSSQESGGHLASAGPMVGVWPSLCPPNAISFTDQGPLPATLMGDAASICCHGYQHPAGPPTRHLMEGLWWAPGGGPVWEGLPRGSPPHSQLSPGRGQGLPSLTHSSRQPALHRGRPGPRRVRPGQGCRNLGSAPGSPPQLPATPIREALSSLPNSRNFVLSLLPFPHGRRGSERLRGLLHPTPSTGPRGGLPTQSPRSAGSAPALALGTLPGNDCHRPGPPLPPGPPCPRLGLLGRQPACLSLQPPPPSSPHFTGEEPGSCPGRWGEEGKAPASQPHRPPHPDPP